MEFNEVAFYALPPLVGALIGWLTNMLAVRLLFRPRRPVSILGFKLQGLIPKRHLAIAESVGNLVERELINHDDLRAALAKPGFHDRVVDFLQDKLDAYLQDKLLKLSPLVSSFISPSLVTSVREGLLNEFIKHLPDLIVKMSEAAEGEIDIRGTVVDKINAFELSKLEEVILQLARREFRLIEVLGGVLGFLVGCGQVGLMLLVR